MKTHPKLVSVLTLVWLIVFTKLVYAASGLPPFSQDFLGFDFESMLYAAGAGLLGGAGRTIYSLASEKVLVGSLWREGTKDAILSLLCGVVAWAIVTTAANFWPGLFTSWVRMLIIVWAGTLRGRLFNLLGDWISDGLSALKTRAINGVRGTPIPIPVDPQPSAVVPLENQK